MPIKENISVRQLKRDLSLWLPDNYNKGCQKCGLIRNLLEHSVSTRESLTGHQMDLLEVYMDYIYRTDRQEVQLGGRWKEDGKDLAGYYGDYFVDKLVARGGRQVCILCNGDRPLPRGNWVNFVVDYPDNPLRSTHTVTFNPEKIMEIQRHLRVKL